MCFGRFGCQHVHQTQQERASNKSRESAHEGSIVSRDDVGGRVDVQLDGLVGSERIKVKLGSLDASPSKDFFGRSKLLCLIREFHHTFAVLASRSRLSLLVSHRGRVRACLCLLVFHAKFG